MIAWLSSKVALLLFAAAMFASIMGVAVLVKNLSILDAGQRELYTLSRLVDSTCSAPFNSAFETTVELSKPTQVSAGVSNGFYFISLNNNKRGVHCPLSATAFTAAKVKVRRKSGVVTLAAS